MEFKIYNQRVFYTTQCSGCLLQYTRLALTHKLNYAFYVFRAAELYKLKIYPVKNFPITF